METWITEENPTAAFELLAGDFADIGQFDDFGLAEVEILVGPHTGHVATVDTAKFNCGAYRVDARCTCGAAWQNAMRGCWQYNHQREAAGDESLDLF